MTVLVTGARGSVGGAVLAGLVAAGEPVRDPSRGFAGLGEELRDGDVVITGSTVPLVDCSGGGHFVVSSPHLGTVEVTLA